MIIISYVLKVVFGLLDYYFVKIYHVKICGLPWLSGDMTDIPVCGNIADWFVWLDSLRVPLKVRLILEGVGGTLMWSIWNFRNSLIFSSCPPKKAVLWDSIVSQYFVWISYRNPSCKLSWIGWLKNPVATVTSM